MQLERDLARAEIKPFTWVVNQSLTPLEVRDPVLLSRRAHEATYLEELVNHADRMVLEPLERRINALAAAGATAETYWASTRRPAPRHPVSSRLP